ncbi:MAG: zinc ribbon domain-containing protein [Bacteroidota bacterium]
MHCTQCGNPLKEGARFCNKCGAVVKLPQETQPQQPQHLAPPIQKLQDTFTSVKNEIIANLKPTEKNFPNENTRNNISENTEEGGLETIPENFDEPNGDWKIINSSNPFEILFLDWKNKTVSPAIVKRNFETLQKFWLEKTSVLDNAGNREIFKNKYGAGTVENSLVTLKNAYMILFSEKGISDCYNKINNERIRRGEENLTKNIKNMLDGGIASKAEIDLQFKKGLQYHLSKEESAEILKRNLDKRKFLPGGQISGSTLVEQLLSVDQWISEKKIGENKIAKPAPQHQVNKPTSAPVVVQEKKKRKIIWIVIISFIIILGGGFGAWWYNQYYGFAFLNNNSFFNISLTEKKQNVLPIYFTNHYSGTIGSSTIQIQLTRQKEKLSGNYMLLKKMYSLEGPIDSKGKIILSESSLGKPTGSWTGNISTSNIIGEWKKYMGNQKGTLFLSLKK